MVERMLKNGSMADLSRCGGSQDMESLHKSLSRLQISTFRHVQGQAGKSHLQVAPQVLLRKSKLEVQRRPDTADTKKTDVYSFAMVCYEILHDICGHGRGPIRLPPAVCANLFFYKKGGRTNARNISPGTAEAVIRDNSPAYLWTGIRILVRPCSVIP